MLQDFVLAVHVSLPFRIHYTRLPFCREPVPTSQAGPQTVGPDRSLARLEPAERGIRLHQTLIRSLKPSFGLNWQQTQEQPDQQPKFLTTTDPQV